MWLEALDSCTDEMDSSRGDKKLIRTKIAADAVKSCQVQRKKNGMLCGTQFGIMKKRHTCKKCGALCCSLCSPYRVFLASGAGKKSRVCTICLPTLIEEIPENKRLYSPREMPPPDTPDGTTAAGWGAAQLASPVSRERSISRSPTASTNMHGNFDTHGYIKITLVKGRDLQIPHARRPDPFVVITSARGDKVTSGTARRTDSPEWNQEFRMYVESLHKPLTLEAFDAGSISRQEQIGSTLLDLSELADGKLQQTQIELINNHSQTSGTIYIWLRFLKAFKPKMSRRISRDRVERKSLTAANSYIGTPPRQLSFGEEPGFFRLSTTAADALASPRKEPRNLVPKPSKAPGRLSDGKFTVPSPPRLPARPPITPSKIRIECAHDSQ